ncbi:MAG TPA: SPOR domain-containing protein [Burkholderiaceae bacterium]|nr:SPOR domain-containing protein [Burkholderiaceae bacterium]
MKKQRGGFILGLIVGLLVGLALALGVALYVTKVPVPFINKVPQRSAEQDKAEAERLRNWDPNTPLQGRSPAPPATPPAAGPAPGAQPAQPRASSPLPPGLRGQSGRDPAAILSGQDAAGPGVIYFVQAGAFAKLDDAEQQRARLAMQGYAAKISEREQAGRTVYRVRLGPYDNQTEAESQRDRLTGNGVDATLVRVQK